MDWLRLGFEIALKLGEVIVGALQRGDDAVLDQKVSDLLGQELRTTLARRAAEMRAEERFRGRQDEPTQETRIPR